MTRFYDRLAAYFAHIAVTQGPLTIRGDVIEPMPDTPSKPHFDDSEQDKLPLEAVQRIGSEAERLVSVDDIFSPAESCGPCGSQSVFASFATLNATVFSFWFAPLGTDDGAGDITEVAKSYCDAQGLELLGACFMADTLEILAIVRGTREETEAKAIALWQAADVDEFDWSAWRQERFAEPV